jgi:hypothetical protein
MRNLNKNRGLSVFPAEQYAVSAAVPTESPATDPLMSYWVAHMARPNIPSFCFLWKSGGEQLLSTWLMA